MEKTGNKTDISPRAALLARAIFFPERFVCGNTVFAEIPVQESLVHSVAIDPENGKFSCTCSFRPKPCVHAMALKALLDREGEQDFVAVEALPDWVSALLAGQPVGNRASNRVSAGKTKEQRRFERLERAASGFEDLEAWLHDTARRGLATVVSEDPKWWEGIAARLADASMTGLSRTLRLAGQIPATGPDWADRTASIFASCYLAVRAFRKRDTMPEPLLHDLQQFIGINIKKESVLSSGEKVSDTWAIVGQIEEHLEERLSMRSTWLLGAKTGRFGRLLDYSFGSDGFPPGFEPGSISQGTLAFYPSAYPLRALVAGDWATVPKKVEKMPGFEDFEIFALCWSAALAAQPWLSSFPAVWSDVIPIQSGGRFVALDQNQKSLSLDVPELTGWKMVALSSGRPLSIFGEWNGIGFRPLSVVAEGRFVTL